MAVMLLALIALLGLERALPYAVFLLGLANGAFAVSALGVMMDLSAAGGPGREGLHMGLWGASQALAFAAGGLGAGVVVDVSRHLFGSAAAAYGMVLGFDACLFLAACCWALQLQDESRGAGSLGRLHTDVSIAS